MGGADGLNRESFNQNDAILKKTAEWLSRQGEPDMDELVPKVEQAMRAYVICKDRLNQVQEALGKCLGEDESSVQPPPTAANGASRIRSARFSADGEVEDDDDAF